MKKIKKGQIYIKHKDGDSSTYDISSRKPDKDKKYNRICELRFSNHNKGQHPGKLAYSLEDNGDGIIFRDEHMDYELAFDYSQWDAIMILSSVTRDKDEEIWYEGKKKRMKL